MNRLKSDSEELGEGQGSCTGSSCTLFLDREDSLVDQALAVAIGGAPVRLYPDLCVQGRNLLIWKILWVFR